MQFIQKHLGTVLIAILIGAIVGGFYANIVHELYGRETDGKTLVQGGIRGALVTIIVLVFEMAIAWSRAGGVLRRVPFGLSLVIRAIVTFAVLKFACPRRMSS